MKSYEFIRLKILLFSCAFFTSSVLSSNFNYSGPSLKFDYSGSIIVDNSHYKYTASDRLTFNTEDYLRQYLPTLLPMRGAIDTWASMQGIHPKLLSEMMHAYFSGEAVDNSFENKQKVFQIATGLSQGYRQNKNSDLAASLAVTAIANAFHFDLNLADEYKSKRTIQQHSYLRGSVSPPIFSYFNPPWPSGEFWSGGGAHTYTGSGDNPKNSLDFFKSYISWGSNTSDVWVSASQAGIVRVFSECNINVIHPNGWVTSYYHLENIIVSDMQQVAYNQKMSNYADDLATATCQGGSSTGPHVHFSVYFEDDDIEVDEFNLDFTSWSHHAGIENYDNNCSTSYYTMIPSNNIVCPHVLQLPNNNPSEFIFYNGFEP